MSDPAEAAAPREVTETDPGAGDAHALAGDMGVSSERVGKVRGSAEPTTNGAEQTHPEPPEGD